MLLADEAQVDPHAADLEIAPPLRSARAAAGTRPGQWQVACLGRFQLWSDGRLAPSCSSRRGWGVLQYLVVRPGSAAPRDALIGAFWRGAEPAAGAHNLQVAVHALRRSLRG